ncbi:GyrI-like domain-containing protein [Zunongwangia sp. F363]|uniref:GyrI-like domain-containing protein n=1 Tax=Autumnicola tepida TaxID=3075595 RepID=A0ABU3CDV8_9FLAO|nr:GyrI-like domain-containing protein [Zunongwangia sp. F363]MDT0644443.1 GyrI-like domain-containing protein [Zunongwangia sp. F363]
MKIFKYLLFLILILIIGTSIYVATLKGDFQVEETRLINAPQEVVFNEVNELRNWQDWEPWSGDAQDMIVNYGDTTSGENATYAWKSESMGNGKITTTKANPFSSIQQKITFETSFGESSSDVYWNFEETENGTQVTWGMKGEQSFMEKAAFMFRDESITEMMRPEFAEGLQNMEQAIEKKMNVYSINVDGITQHGGGYYMYTTTASKVSQIDEKMGNMIEDIAAYMDQNNIERTGNPFVLYNEWNQENNSAIFSAAYFTPSEVITPAESPVLTGYMPNQKVVKTTLKGNYDKLQETWDRAYAFIQENDLQLSTEEKAFEVYLVGPDKSKNPADWVTSIYIPVQ